MRRIFLASLCAFCCLACSANADEADTEQRIRELSEKLRCLVCQNQSLADSNAELAGDLRREVNEQVRAGRSDEQIISFLVQRYGDFVLYEPPFNPLTALLWLGPYALLAGAAAMLVFNLRRRRAPPTELKPQDRQLVAQVLDLGKPMAEASGDGQNPQRENSSAQPR